MVILVMAGLLLLNLLLIRLAVYRVVARGMPLAWRLAGMVYLVAALLPVLYALFWAHGHGVLVRGTLRTVLELMSLPIYFVYPAILAARVAAIRPEYTTAAQLAGCTALVFMPFCAVGFSCLLAGACF